MFRVCLILVFMCGWSLILAAIPSYLSICHQSDPKLVACVKNSIEQLRPKLREGIKELNVPALEPLHIDDIRIARGNGQYKFELNLTDIDVIGASDFQLDRLKLDIPNVIYKMGVSFPQLQFKGNYTVDTRFLALPITAAGKFEANATGVSGIGILKGSLVRDQFEHLQFSDLTINLKFADYQLHLDNTGTGDATLHEAINGLANTSKDELIGTATPFIEIKAAEVILKLANSIVNTLPYMEVFPE